MISTTYDKVLHYLILQCPHTNFFAHDNVVYNINIIHNICALGPLTSPPPSVVEIGMVLVYLECLVNINSTKKVDQPKLTTSTMTSGIFLVQ